MTLDHCLNDGVRGEPIAKLLAPEKSDFFVLKPKHSAFFATTLDTLLKYLEIDTLILAGIATDMCVLVGQAMRTCAISILWCRMIAPPPKRVRRIGGRLSS